MKKVTLYTDGGCRGNQQKHNVGAYAGILIYSKTGDMRQYSKAFYDTTNNQMEMLGILEGLKLLKEPCEVHIYSDSAYVVNAINKHWIDKWKRMGWSRGTGPLKNREIWIEIDKMRETHDLHFHKVKGHSTDHYNNLADQLVNEAMDELSKDKKRKKKK